jgi:hypothetical protein
MTPIASAVRRDPMVTLVGCCIAISALAPRPTFAHPSRFLAPALAVTIVVAALLFAAVRARRAESQSRRAALLLIPSAAYAFRVAFESETSEYDFVASRFLMVFVIMSVAYVVAEHDVDFVMRSLLVGGVVLGVLVLVIGVTGSYFLEPVRPARTLGVQLPFFKTAGVPRSFGEQGILVSLMLAHVLVYWSHLGRVRRSAALIAAVLLVAFGQSRNMLLAALVVVVAVMVASARRYKLLAALLLTATFATFIVAAIIPLISATTVGSALIGEGIYERNVFARFSLTDAATDLLASDPLGAVLGYTREEWGAHYASSSGEEEGVHNHLLATVLFLGVPAGVASLWLMFWHPATQILSQLGGDGLDVGQRHRRHFLLVALSGVLTSINFYEGFFSLFVAFFVGFMMRVAYTPSEGVEGSFPQKTH